MSANVATAVYESIRCMPAELSRLMAAYLDERPHTFTSVGGFVDVVYSSDQLNNRPDGAETAIFGLQYGTSGLRWTTLVSAEPLSTGHLQWTVEFYLIQTSYLVLIAAGVTSKSSNNVTFQSATNLDFADMTNNQDWLVFPVPFSKTMYAAHDGNVRITEPTIEIPKSDVGVRYRIVFNADQKNGRISANVFVADFDRDRFRSAGPPVTLVVAPIQDFNLLRPCVVIGGPQKAVVRSGTPPTDWFY
jgi:hypothetical protein